jgi:hypothetical protein
MNRLRRLTGQIGFSPVNCWKVTMACVQSVAMFGAERVTKSTALLGGQRRSGSADVGQSEARETVGAFRTTNQGCFSLEVGKQRRFRAA